MVGNISSTKQWWFYRLTCTTIDSCVFCNRTMCVVGPSHSSKTTFVLYLPKHLFCQGELQRYLVLWNLSAWVEQSLTRRRQTHAAILPVADNQPYDIIVLDDLIHKNRNSNDVSTIFSRIAHRRPCFIIFITQYLLSPGKEAHTRSLNTHYYVTFQKSSGQDTVWRHCSSNSFKKRSMIDIFEADREKPFPYVSRSNTSVRKHCAFEVIC